MTPLGPAPAKAQSHGPGEQAAPGSMPATAAGRHGRSSAPSPLLVFTFALAKSVVVLYMEGVLMIQSLL